MSKNAACESSGEVRGQHAKKEKLDKAARSAKKLGIKTPGLLFFYGLLEQTLFQKRVGLKGRSEEVLPFSKSGTIFCVSSADLLFFEKSSGSVALQREKKAQFARAEAKLNERLIESADRIWK